MWRKLVPFCAQNHINCVNIFQVLIKEGLPFLKGSWSTGEKYENNKFSHYFDKIYSQMAVHTILRKISLKCKVHRDEGVLDISHDIFFIQAGIFEHFGPSAQSINCQKFDLGFACRNVAQFLMGLRCILCKVYLAVC